LINLSYTDFQRKTQDIFRYHKTHRGGSLDKGSRAVMYRSQMGQDSAVTGEDTSIY